MLRSDIVDYPIIKSMESVILDIPEGVNPTPISLQNPVSNLDWAYINFLDTKLYSPAAEAFLNNKEKTGDGRYTNAVYGTTEYRKYWTEERRRCLDGFQPEVDGKPVGPRITGEHYFYLNYCQIDREVIVDIKTGDTAKQLGFPDFLLMDYYWFLELEKNENPGRYGLPQYEKKGMIVAKSRRKGWSFKNAAGVAWKYSFFKRSYCIIGTYLKEHAAATFNMTLNVLNFLDEYTEFGGPRLVNRNDEIESGWVVKEGGREIKKGNRSIIKIMTFKDSGFKSVGKSCTRMLFEEAGLFENLEQAYTISSPLFRSGTSMIGIPIIFGTGGDMMSATQDFAKMFYNPKQYGLAEYNNIYEENSHGVCGYFIDEMWYRPGDLYFVGKIGEKIYRGVDSNGNPLRWAAEIDLFAERDKKRGTDNKAYAQSITQWCRTPSEAFMLPEGNIFPTAELYDRLSRLKTEDHFKYIGTAGTLFFSEDIDAKNGIKFSPDLEGKLNPLYNYRVRSDENRNGCIVIYEHPIDIDGEVPKDMYIIGHDPYGTNSDEGESLGVTYVLKTRKYIKYGHDQIVASYIGRPTGGNSMTIYNTNLEKLSQYYGNAKIMFENDRGDVQNYFLKKKKLHILYDEPGTVMLKTLGKKTYGRVKGCSMGTDKMKQQAELYVYDWLMEKRGVSPEGRDMYNLDMIPDIGLLEELILYNRDGNFDRVSAFFQVVIAIEENFNKHETISLDRDTTLDFLMFNKKLFPYRTKPSA